MLSHWAGSSPIASAVQSLFRAGEPGAVFIAQKPSDLLVRKNLLLATAALSTQSVALAPGGTYTLSGGGTGTVTLSGGATGVFTAPTTLTFVVNAGSSVTFTVAGSVTTAQLEKGSTASTYQPVTDWTTEYLAAVGNLVTQYTDNLGTTPVTDLEQTVGLHLDTRPILLGPELVTNGRFNTDVTGWSSVAGGGGTDTLFSWVGGACRMTRGVGSNLGAPTQGVPTVAGRRYQLQWNNTLAGGYAIGSVSGGVDIATTTPSLVGSNTVTFTATGSSTWPWFWPQNGQTSDLDNVSLREVISASNTVGQPLRGAEQLNSASGFSSATGWTLGAGYSIGSNILSIAGGTAFATATYTLPNVPAGTFAEVTLTATRTSGSGTLSVQLAAGSNVQVITVQASGTYRGIVAMPAGGGNRVALIEDASGGWVGSVSVMSLKPVYGNHRSQSSAPARARLSARYNKVGVPNANPVSVASLVKTGDAAAVLSIVSDTVALAAAGLSQCTLGNVYKLDNSAGVSNASVGIPGAIGNLAPQLVTVWARGTGGGIFYGYNNNNFIGPSPVTTAYQKFQGTGPAPSATNVTMGVSTPAGGVIYFILPDMRDACYSYLPLPQIVWDATTGYDDTGFPARLVRSGAQGEATGAVDFSGVAQAQVWFGQAKLGGAALGMLVELSPVTDTNGGTFDLYVNTTSNYYANLNTGAGGAESTLQSSGAYPVPTASVLCARYDVTQAAAANQITLRSNGVADASSYAAAQAAGTALGNYLLSYGARGNTSSAVGTLPFIGDEFISIVRGGATPDANTISYVERFCARYPALTF